MNRTFLFLVVVIILLLGLALWFLMSGPSIGSIGGYECSPQTRVEAFGTGVLIWTGLAIGIWLLMRYGGVDWNYVRDFPGVLEVSLYGLGAILCGIGFVAVSCVESTQPAGVTITGEPVAFARRFYGL